MSPRSQTLGTLGRAPARASTPPPVAPAPPPPERGPLRGWLQSAMFDNIGLKFLSMVLAVTVFLLVNTDKDREITARVGVSYTLPEDKVLVSERIDEVRVTIKGAWRRLRKFDEREIDRINLDLRRASSGELAITTDMIHLPSGVSVTAINPRSVRVVFDKRVDKIVEITPSVIGQAQHGYKVLEVKPVPATIKLRGGETMLAALTAIRTREIGLDGRTDSFMAETEVVPPEGAEVVGSPQIAVQIHIDEELVTRKLPGVTVLVRGDLDAARWSPSPAQVDVTLTGALLGVEKARTTLVPVVRLPPEGKPREAEVTIDGLPPGIGVKVSPEHVKLVPVKQAPTAAPPRAP
ncbi:MAG TPA: CdaR family protein [Kofleriaceae bacterium]|nr:CdaR family protein [Kofleriaceae bacterium]